VCDIKKVKKKNRGYIYKRKEEGVGVRFNQKVRGVYQKSLHSI